MNTRTEILIFQRTGSMNFTNPRRCTTSLWHVLNTSQERSTNDIKEVSLCKFVRSVSRSFSCNYQSLYCSNNCRRCLDLCSMINSPEHMYERAIRFHLSAIELTSMSIRRCRECLGLTAYVGTQSRSVVDNHPSLIRMLLQRELRVAFVAFDDAPGVWRISQAVLRLY